MALTRTQNRGSHLTNPPKNLILVPSFPRRTPDEERQNRITMAHKTSEANLRLRDGAATAIRKLDERYSITADFTTARYVVIVVL